MKSLSDTQPDFGFASTPVDVQRYVEGRLHVPPGGGVVGGGVVGGGVVGGGVVGVVSPVHVTPFRAKLVGAGLLPVHEPLKPNDTVPLVATAPL